MKNIIFIPGVMGSELKEGKVFGGIKRWYRIWDLNVKRLKMMPDKKDKIYPGKPLKHGYKLIGNTFRKNIVYENIMKTLEELNINDYNFIPYGYDWRKDISSNCKDLHDLLEGLNGEEIHIVAHSMGGLLTHTYCQWAQKKGKLPNIKNVITLGTPWSGSPDAIKVLKYGIQDRGLFFPKSETTLDISRTFPSAFQLLPSMRYFNSNNCLISSDKNLRWGEFMDLIQSLEGCNVEAVSSLNSDIHNSLTNPWPTEIKHYNFIGVNQGTVGVFKQEPNGEFKNGKTVDGDEIVPLDSAVPIFNCEQILYTVATHTGLVLHNPVLEWIKTFFESGSSPKGIEGVWNEYEARTNWIMEKIDCPVDVYIQGEEDDDINRSSNDISRHKIGETTYLIYNRNKPINIEIEAYDIGRTSIENIRCEEGKPNIVTKFPSLDADPARKALINTTFENDLPQTRVYIADEDNLKEIEVQGITVELPEKNISTPPLTKVELQALGREDKLHFDEKGVKLSFDVTEYTVKCLETRYRVNEGIWKRFEYDTDLTYDNGLQNGRNTIEFYSIDVYDNTEKIKKQVFFIEPSPKLLYKVILNPDTDGKIYLNEYYTGVNKYKYTYKIGENQQPIQYEDSINFRAYEERELFIQATDKFGRKSPEEVFNQSFQKFTNTVWDEAGYEGTVGDLINLLPNINQQEPISIFYGRKKNELSLEDTIPKTVNNLSIKNDNIEYNIELLPKLEFYLDFHSQRLRRSDNNVTISFYVYDTNGNLIVDIHPTVKCVLLPTKKTISPEISENGQGGYSFNVPIGELSEDVEKIKFEFRDKINREKSITTTTFKVI